MSLFPEDNRGYIFLNIMNANFWKKIQKYPKNIQHTILRFSHLVEFDSPWQIGHLLKIDFPDPDSLSLNLAI